MAHGNFNSAPMYICTKGGRYYVRDELGREDVAYFKNNQVVGCEGKFVSEPAFSRSVEDYLPISKWRYLRESDNPKRYWYELNTGYYDKWTYLDGDTFESCFRPVERKHKEVKEFNTADELNVWLKDKKPETVEKIEGIKDKYSVVFINDGDEKYIKDFD